MSASEPRLSRSTVAIYVVVIVINLLVLPTWFAPGRFPLTSRVAFITLSVLLVVFCAWKLSALLGGNPLRRRGPHPSGQLREGYGDDLYDRDDEYDADARYPDVRAADTRDPDTRDPDTDELPVLGRTGIDNDNDDDIAHDNEDRDDEHDEADDDDGGGDTLPPR